MRRLKRKWATWHADKTITELVPAGTIRRETSIPAKDIAEARQKLSKPLPEPKSGARHKEPAPYAHIRALKLPRQNYDDSK